MDKRKSVRRSVAYPAWIRTEPEREPIACALADISASGAQLIVDAGLHLPARFELVLANGSDHTRACLVVRRKGNRLGLRFTKPGPA